MKKTRTYQDGCKHCNATGFVRNEHFGMNKTPMTDTCPVCNGSKVIIVTEVEEDNIKDQRYGKAKEGTSE